jgi:aldehyde dehydrogenase (NAD+)
MSSDIVEIVQEKDEMKKLFQEQQDFYKSGETRSVEKRIKLLKELKAVLKQNEQRLHEAIYADFQKSEFETYATELAPLYEEIDRFIKRTHKWSRPQRVRTDLINIPGKSIRIPEPLGTCLIIGAWNYPYNISLIPAVSAIAAGNTVIIKPSEVPAKTSEVMADLINNHLNTKHIAVVEGGIPETTELLSYKWDKIFFTGSPKVGKIVYQKAAEQLIPVTLELGGKSPTFITKSANLKIAVQRLVWAKFLNAGQTCIAPDYVYVDQSIKNAFLKLLKEELNKRNYTFGAEHYVQIIDRKNLQRLAELINPKKVFYGGLVDEENRYIQPTVLENVSWEDRVMQEEIFGPILPILSYANLQDAVDEVKKQLKPLSCYVYTEEKKDADRILEQISFGGGMVNDSVTHFSNARLGFGGIGNSGMGSYHGKFGFDTFTHYKGVIKKPTWFELPLKYGPYTSGKLSWIKRLLG